MPSPSPAQSNEKKGTGAELVKALVDALGRCDGAMPALTTRPRRRSHGEGEQRAAVVSALLHGLESHGMSPPMRQGIATVAAPRGAA
jgi:hypothetical protein